MINMAKETDKSRDAGQKKSQASLVVLANKFCTMAPNIFIIIIAVLFIIIIITITIRHDEALIDMFRP